MSAGGVRPLLHLGRLVPVAVVTIALALVAACGAPAAQPPPGPAGASDEPTSSAAASPAALSASPRGTLVVHGIGDVNLDPVYIPALRARGYEHAWTGLGRPVHRRRPDGRQPGVPGLGPRARSCRRSSTSVAIPPPCRPPRPPGWRWRTWPTTTAGLRPRGHARLGGAAARAGIAPVGVGANLRAASTPAVVERDGWRIAVLGFGGVVPAADWLAGPSRPGMASGDDTAAMVAAVRAAGEVADLVFVTVHWGVELDTQPRADDVARAQAMIDAGADGDLRPSRAPAAAARLLPRPADRLGAGQLRVAERSRRPARARRSPSSWSSPTARCRLPAPGPDHLAGPSRAGRCAIVRRVGVTPRARSCRLSAPPHRSDARPPPGQRERPVDGTRTARCRPARPVPPGRRRRARPSCRRRAGRAPSRPPRPQRPPPTAG